MGPIKNFVQSGINDLKIDNNFTYCNINIITYIAFNRYYYSYQLEHEICITIGPLANAMVLAMD